MIVLSSALGSGINIFIPAFFSGNGKIVRVVEWKHYRRLNPVFLLINAIFISLSGYILICKVSIETSRIYSALGPLVLIYVICRLKFGRRVIEIRVEPGTTRRSVAPWQVWMDYISLGTMFFLVGTINAENTDNEMIYIFSWSMKIFYLVYSLLPFINYAAFRLNRKRH